MHRLGGQRAQASAELVAAVPLLLLVALVLGQLVVAGWALLSAGEAARAGARAAHVGADVRSTAKRAVPAALAPAEVRARGERVTVAVRAPALIPGIPSIALSASAALDPEAGAG